MEADLPGILQITIRTEWIQLWKKHKLWNQRCLCSNTNTWSCYLNLLSLNFYTCEMRIQCLYHTFVVGINWDNTRRATSKIPELFYPVPLGRAAIRSVSKYVIEHICFLILRRLSCICIPSPGKSFKYMCFFLF